MTNIINLDFEITPEQLEALQLHTLFKEKHFYEDIEYELKEKSYDLIQVWFEGCYNDNWFDVTPIYADLIIGDKIIKKVRLVGYPDEIEVHEFNLPKDTMLSFTITPKMI